MGVGIKVRWTEQELAGAAELGKRIVPGGPRVDAVERALKVAGVAGLWTAGHPGVDTLLEHIRDSWRPGFDLKALGGGALNWGAFFPASMIMMLKDAQKLAAGKKIQPTRLILGLTITTPEQAKSFDRVADAYRNALPEATAHTG